MSLKKQIPFPEAAEVFSRLKTEGKKLVQCHGTFDLIHPGHITHFEEAKALGDVLVVTVTGEKYVNKGPGRPYFNDQMRAKSISALECVDYVVVIPFAAAVEAIECVKPCVYCKGKEYEAPENDVTGNIYDDVRTVEKHGGKIHYVGSVVFSSTRLINNHFDVHSGDVKRFCQRLSKEYGPDRFRQVVESFQDVKVLVVGDIIFDRYTTVDVQGLTSKNRILSGRYTDESTQAGGALASIKHVLSFAPNSKLISIVGSEPWVEKELQQHLPKHSDLVVRSSHFTTVLKQRFVEPQKPGIELSKLFSVNYLDENHPNGEIEAAILKRIEAEIDLVDVVLVMDFGHGVMSEKIREFVQKRAKFLALNCQTNSNNHGFNIINRQYQRADSFTLDNAEITLACGKQDFDHEDELNALKSKFSSKYAWLTRGDIETIGIKTDEPPCKLPPLKHHVVDTIGAGDAFCAVSSLAAACGLPIQLATFMGQIAGGQAVEWVGNSKHLEVDRFLKSGMSMLSF